MGGGEGGGDQVGERSQWVNEVSEDRVRWVPMVAMMNGGDGGGDLMMVSGWCDG